MQKLEERNTYTPTDTPHVRSNCDLSLNRGKAVEETLSVSGLKTFSNNSDVALTACPKGKAGQNLSKKQLSVYVLSMRGKPLMPTTPRKARKLLKEKKAKVVKRTPFTIQLNYNCSERTQNVNLGVDSGYKDIGLSATTDKKEVYSGEIKLRNDIVKLNQERKEYRRNRKTWYRPARFLNRKIPKGWLAPSIQHKLDSHIKAIRMQNPEIAGIEYQQGELHGYEIREYLLEKFNRKCSYCGKANVPLEIEHIIPYSRGGSSRVSNLTIACHDCNQKKGNMTASEFGHPEVEKQAKQPLKESAFMNIVRWKLVNQLREENKNIEVEHTYGYITKRNRILLGINKSHSNDAFLIAGGITQKRNSIEYSIKQVRKFNRKLFRGDRSHIKNTADRFIKGFQRFDKVMWKGIECFVFGRRATGYFDLRKLDVRNCQYFFNRAIKAGYAPPHSKECGFRCGFAYLCAPRRFMKGVQFHSCDKP